jgi:CheY-like chemotaxis protein
VELYFPAAPSAAAPPPVAAASPAATAALRGGTEHVLIADDDPAVRRVAMRALSRFGYRVLPVDDGAQALEAFRAHGDTIDLVVSDMTMPRMTGLELYRRLRAGHSAVRFLFTSGYELSREETAADPRLRSLAKPWTVDELVRAVREFLDS